MNAALPGALDEAPANLVDTMTNHPKDRHVLALAVRVRASRIVTNNPRDCPDNACAEQGVEAGHVTLCVLAAVIEAFITADLRDHDVRDRDRPGQLLSSNGRYESLNNHYRFGAFDPERCTTSPSCVTTTAKPSHFQVSIPVGDDGPSAVVFEARENARDADKPARRTVPVGKPWPPFFDSTDRSARTARSLTPDDR